MLLTRRVGLRSEIASQGFHFRTSEITANCSSNKLNTANCPGSLLPTRVDTMPPVEKDG